MSSQKTFKVFLGVRHINLNLLDRLFLFLKLFQFVPEDIISCRQDYRRSAPLESVAWQVLPL